MGETAENQPFKSFVSKEEFEGFMSKNEEKLKAKLETDIKSKIEKEAKLTAEQKLMEKVKELENEKKLVLIDKNKIKAEKEFIAKGLGMGNYSEIIDFIVSEDEEETLQKTRKLIDFIETNSKRIADEKIKKTMKDVSKPEHSKVSNQNSNENIAQRLGKSRSETYKSANETLKKYF